MKHCTHCGHPLGLGRFCTNCGAPVAARDPLSDPIEVVRQAEPTEPPPAEDWQDSTAERPAPLAASTPLGPPPSAPPSAPPRLSPEPSPPRVPPVVVEPPPPPRFPLFADEVSEAAAAPAAAPRFSPSPPAPVAVELTEVAADEDDEDDWEDWEDEGRPRAVWVVAALAVLAVLVLGAWFLGQKIGGDDTTEDPTASGTSGSGSGQESERVDHTGDASADAPRTAEPNVDVDGNPTSYDASNMLDGVPETAWRTEGDASGTKIVFTFADPTRITEVGLINGYAKKARDGGKVLDWYEGTRRIQQVTWIFTGGQTVRQNLSDDRELQTIEVEPVEVTKVVLKIVATTAPGEGAARRDFTAISDVLFAEG